MRHSYITDHQTNRMSWGTELWDKYESVLKEVRRVFLSVRGNCCYILY